MKLVIIESPYAGEIETNVAYARRCLRDSLRRGEAPLASHLLYTQDGVLDDLIAEERRLGMQAGFTWGAHAELVAVYTDRGISGGMWKGIEVAKARGTPIEYRKIGTDGGSP